MNNNNRLPHQLLSGNSPVKREKSRDFKKAMTEAETILWTRLKSNRLRNLHFRRQQVIAGFIVDFYCHSAKLVVEVDGAIHAKQYESDLARDAVLTSLGCQILRFQNEDVLFNLRSVMLEIAIAATL